MSSLDRRTFLRGAAASAAAALVGCRTDHPDHEQTIRVGPTTEEAHGLGAEEANAPTMSDGRPALRMVTVEADGAPLDVERMKTLIARDLPGDPLPQAIVLAGGRARIELASEPIQIAIRLKVPDFGEVYCYADNNGRGYTKPQTLDFVVEAAQTRVRRVRETLERYHGVKVDNAFNEQLSAAARPIPAGKSSARTSAAYDSLSHGLYAGEMLTLAIARDRISRLQKPRDDFKFGIMCAGYGSLGPKYDQAIRDAFNFSTVAWYTWKDEEPPAQRIDYARMDSSIDWCLERKIIPKTFGYLYMARGATPEWIRPNETLATTGPTTGAASELVDPSTTKRQYNERWPYERIKALYTHVVRETTARYVGKPVPYVEVMNEAHDKANLWRMSHDQILDMARSAFTAAREGNPTIKRMMNHCCMWAEYAKGRNNDGSRRWSPYRFIKDCVSNGVEFETIGLQLYYPQNDLFEINRMLERFEEFNKPLHITEMATASAPGLDPISMRPNNSAPGWHGPWSQSTQADWAEGIFTLCYSKPSFEVAGWWDLTDKPGHFWPFGGMLDGNLDPKESFTRLIKLQKQWGVGMPTT